MSHPPGTVTILLDVLPTPTDFARSLGCDSVPCGTTGIYQVSEPQCRTDRLGYYIEVRDQASLKRWVFVGWVTCWVSFFFSFVANDVSFFQFEQRTGCASSSSWFIMNSTTTLSGIHHLIYSWYVFSHLSSSIISGALSGATLNLKMQVPLPLPLWSSYICDFHHVWPRIILFLFSPSRFVRASC